MSIRDSMKRHPLWLGFAAAVVPLVVLLVLQYSWLVQLEDRSVEAYGAYLDRVLEAVTTKVEDVYRSRAERTLSLPPTVFQNFDAVAYKIQLVDDELDLVGTVLGLIEFQAHPTAVLHLLGHHVQTVLRVLRDALGALVVTGKRQGSNHQGHNQN